MWKIVTWTIGAITTIIAKSLFWEIIGIGIMTGVLLIPKKRMRLTRIT